MTPDVQKDMSTANALQRLAIGDPEERVKQILGIAPRREGAPLPESYEWPAASPCFAACINEDDRIGALVLWDGADPPLAFDGVWIGMTQEDLLSAHPDMQMARLRDTPGFDAAGYRHLQAAQVMIAFLADRRVKKIMVTDVGRKLRGA